MRLPTAHYVSVQSRFSSDGALRVGQLRVSTQAALLLGRPESALGPDVLDVLLDEKLLWSSAKVHPGGVERGLLVPSSIDLCLDLVQHLNQLHVPLDGLSLDPCELLDLSGVVLLYAMLLVKGLLLVHFSHLFKPVLGSLLPVNVVDELLEDLEAVTALLVVSQELVDSFDGLVSLLCAA